jgi:hypothetical protein
VPAGDTWLLRDHLWREQRRVLFAAIGFSSGAPHLQRYDFSTPWTFEIKVQREASGGVPIFRDPTHVKYLIVRDDDRREIPDFASRIRYWDPAAR